MKMSQLLESMTLKEKIGQLLQLAPFFFKHTLKGEVTGHMEDLGISAEDIFLAGSVLGIGGAKEMKELQTTYLAQSRHLIPLLFMADIIHGYRTIFPVPLALAGSFNTELVEATARTAAKEASVSGVHVTFSPMVDLVRDPRWGRVMESGGEDPFLNAVMAKAYVRGYQGDSLNNPFNVASCVKHFAAYGAPEGGRDYNTVDLSKRALYEWYLPAYEAALEEGAHMVMTAFNVVDGVPATGNQTLLKKLLREDWRFEGVIISDYSAVEEMIDHGYSADQKEAARQAIEATLDIEMMSACYIKHLEALVQEGRVDVTLIDEAVTRIVTLKEKLGLFENPFKTADETKEKTIHLAPEHRLLAKQAALESIVLLENDGVLPLNQACKIALIGPYAEERSILGPWSWQGRLDEAITLAEGLASQVFSEQMMIHQGCTLDGEIGDLEETIMIVQQADVCVLALGEPSHFSGEGGSRTNIKLPQEQERLALEVMATGTPTVLVLFNGRPLEIEHLTTQANAVLEAWFPGTEGGSALAEILFGHVNPSGKLPMSFPRNVGQIPVYYNHLNTGRPIKRSMYYRYESHYLDCSNEPLYPFGYGLSYSHFTLTDFSSPKHAKIGDPIQVSVTLTNQSERTGSTVVQLYVRDLSASVVRPVKELKAFKKVTLLPGEINTITLVLKAEAFSFYNQELRLVVEPGLFDLMVGLDSKSVLVKRLALTD